MSKRHSTLAVFALMAMLAAPADAQTLTSWTQAGMLTCRLNPSIGFIIAGHQSMECRFQPNGPFPPQAYEGALNTVGLDIGFTAGGVMGWAVFAPPRVCLPARWPANMSASVATSASAPGSEPTS